MELTITRLDTFEQFVSLQAEWNSLAETQVETIFLTHDWLSCWWQSYNEHNQLWTLTMRDGSDLVGILPLMLQRGIDRFRRLVFMGSGEVTPNHLDIIARPEKRTQVLDALSRYLTQTSTEWDILELDKLPQDSYTIALLKKNSEARRLVTQMDITAHCPFAALPTSFEEYLQGRGASTRSHYRRMLRNLARDIPGACFKIATSPEEIDRVLAALIAMHQARWVNKGYPGTFANPRSVSFHSSIAKRALQSNHLRLYFLQINNQIAAVYYCYRIADRIQYYLGSFDPQWSKYSPGVLINGYTIEQSINESAKRFDFLEGTEPYKDHWATHTLDNVRLQTFSPHWQGKLAQVRTQVAKEIIEWSLKYIPVRIRRPFWQVAQRLNASRSQTARSK